MVKLSKKIFCIALWMSLTDVCSAFSAFAGLESYQPTKPNSAYDISFSSADENSSNLEIYEEINGQWQKKYYNYVYQIKNCPDNSCNSDNRFIPNKTVVDLDTDFYGIEYGAIYNNGLQIGTVTADFIKNTSYLGAAMGKFSADYYIGGNVAMKVYNINVIADGDEYTAIDFADSSFAGQVENKVNSSSGPVYNYNVIYKPENGQFVFERASINPQVNVSSYAAVAAASVLSDEIYSRVLADIDSYFQMKENAPKIKPVIKVFASNDDIDLKNSAGGKSKSGY